jgi:uncharacterized protein YceH (UPF0502 family)
MSILLTAIEARITGCLIEKSLTTPEYYPLTLNSLTLACNQKSNRDPVMDLTEKQIDGALDNLRYQHHLVWHVTSTGSRVPKFKHDVIDIIGLSDAEVAILCVLLLRGPQTPGELRSRSGRLHKFESLAEIVTTLDEMHNRETGALVVKLPREPGSREQRYSHLLCGDVEGVASEPIESPPVPETTERSDRMESLEHELSEVRAELSALKEQFAQFRKQFE